VCLATASSAHAEAVWTRLTFEQTKSDTLTTFPTHEEFMGLTMSYLADSLFSDLNFSRPRPIWIAPAEGEPRNGWFEDTTARMLFDRGFVIREAPADDSLSEGTWSVRYRLDRQLLTLPRVARHGLLGKIWVKRQAEASVHVNVWDTDAGEMVWSGSEAVRVTDWFPKGKLALLEANAPPDLMPEAPTTTEERLAEPILIGAAVGALTVLFFAVR